MNGFDPVEPWSGKFIKEGWGEAWNENLKEIADSPSKMKHGHELVSNGRVYDLKIDGGCARAMVADDEEHEVRIDILPAKDGDEIEEGLYANMLGTEDLICMDTPEHPGCVLVDLLPDRHQMFFQCNCSDKSPVCTHSAAAMYGIARRIDKDPLLLFRLRGLDPEAMFSRVSQRKARYLLNLGEVRTERALTGEMSEEIFGFKTE